MSRMLNRKSVAVVGVLFLFAAAGAYAYFTQTGSGTGSAASGSGQAVVVHQTSTAITDLYPGASAQALSGNFDNGNTGPAYVHQVSATISSVTGPNIDGTHPCAAGDYQLNGFPVTVDADVAAGTGVGAWGGVGHAASIQMLDAGTSQDGCKSATVALAYTSN